MIVTVCVEYKTVGKIVKFFIRNAAASDETRPASDSLQPYAPICLDSLTLRIL